MTVDLSQCLSESTNGNQQRRSGDRSLQSIAVDNVPDTGAVGADKTYARDLMGTADQWVIIRIHGSVNKCSAHVGAWQMV
ncbi:MAG TPA: hypothetical protein DCY79_09260 [Planctomycetaceae bacterium]|nr:hypothetical protein [Blastopirellula sp.]HAY79975.1 hypothetical protein [Planctomycetaceae bacterium]|tara:strand:+ start:813 stop:1052 length:240 start_codon:yes stop_codon:yes gene_type:complete